MTAPPDNVVVFQERSERHIELLLGHLRDRCRQALGSAILTRRPEALAGIPAAALEDVLPKLVPLWRCIATAQAGDDLELLAKRAKCHDPLLFIELMGDGFEAPEKAAREFLAAWREYQSHKITEKLATTIEPEARTELARKIVALGTSPATTLSPADLTNWREAQAADWIVPGLLQAGSVTLLSAIGGVGKSLLTWSLILRLTGGAEGRWLDAFDLPGTPTTADVIEAECGQIRQARRTCELNLGGDVSAETVDAALGNLALYGPEQIPNRGVILGQIQEAVGQTRSARVLVIDPLRSFVPPTIEDENANILMGRIIDQLVAYAKTSGIAILVIDHDSKDGKFARGASAKRDAAEFCWHLVAPDPSDESYLELRPEKARDPGGPGRVAFLRVKGERTAGGLYPVRFERTDVRSTTGNTPERLSARWAAIRRAVDEHHQANQAGIGLTKLSSATGIARTTLQENVTQMIAAGLLYRPSEFSGIYPPSARPETGA